MPMIDMTKALAVTLTFGLAGAALAQETATPETQPADTTATQTQPETAAPAEPAPAAEQAPAADAPGSIYIKETYDDWAERCMRGAEGQPDLCQLYQLLKDEQGNAVAEIGMFPLPKGEKALAGASITAPLETLLTENIVISVDGGKPKVYPFSWCDRASCVARVGFTAEEVATMKKGNKATMTIVPVAAPDQKVVLNISLKGFTKGFEALPTPAAAN